VQIAETFKLMREILTKLIPRTSSNRLFFYDLFIIIFVRGKADHHY